MIANMPDREATAARGYAHKKSYVTLRGIEFLFGDDKTQRRLEILNRDKWTCQTCGRKNLVDYAGFHNSAEWHHRKGRAAGDGLDNGECACHHCQQTKLHPRTPRWTKKPEISA